MEYIDAEKLKRLVGELKERAKRNRCDSWGIVPDALEEVEGFIDSLQQEQPELSNNLVDIDAVREDFITEVYRILDADPTNDRANAIIDAFDSLPTVSQEQPNKYETTLEKARKWMPNVNQGGHAILIDIFPELGEGLDPRYGGRKQEQPEDLEKELNKWMKYGPHTCYPWCTIPNAIKITAEHFYELGQRTKYQQDREEFAKLKAKEQMDGFDEGLNAGKDKLPEIELDKFTEKIKTFQGRYKYPEIVSIKGAMAFMARMFYQYPNVARQWYDNLPKTTMD